MQLIDGAHGQNGGSANETISRSRIANSHLISVKGKLRSAIWVNFFVVVGFVFVSYICVFSLIQQYMYNYVMVLYGTDTDSCCWSCLMLFSLSFIYTSYFTSILTQTSIILEVQFFFLSFSFYVLRPTSTLHASTSAMNGSVVRSLFGVLYMMRMRTMCNFWWSEYGLWQWLNSCILFSKINSILCAKILTVGTKSDWNFWWWVLAKNFRKLLLVLDIE